MLNSIESMTRLQKALVFADKEGGENLFYPNIAAERAKRKMSIDTLAEKIGVTRKTIYNWENAGNIPQTALEKMADLFGCTTDYLLEKVE